MGHFRIWNGAIKSLAEGVGFEPTVGCPTLDFESSALNRTQPPFHFCEIDISPPRSGKERVYYEATPSLCKSARSFGSCNHEKLLTNGSGGNTPRLEQSWLRHHQCS